jgi:sporadic carbohydrate cluster protein (TIGR04323 family)
MKKIIGYVTSQPFGGFCMPVPSQNSCLREYANKKNFTYQLPQLEHKYINCFMQLYTTINIAKQYDGIVMYSYEMLPVNSKLIDLIKLAFNKKSRWY